MSRSLIRAAALAAIGTMCGMSGWAGTDSPAVALDKAERLFRAGEYRQAAQAARLDDAMSTDERYRAIMVQARSALAQGDGPRAQDLFERAANQFGDHTEAEVGLLRASLQAGDFAQAVAWANLIAGEDPDSTEAQALQAFVLDRTGHSEFGLQLLRTARAARPDDVALAAAEGEILIERGLAAEAARRLDAWIARNGGQPDIDRMRARAADALGDSSQAARFRARSSARTAPALDAGVASSTWPRPGFQPFPVDLGAPWTASSGLLLGGGTQVLTVAPGLAGEDARLWVRNGLGVLRAARLERIDADSGLAVLRLDEPFPSAIGFDLANVALPAPGGPGFILGYAVSDPADASYPSMTPGLIVRADSGVKGWMHLTGWVGPSLPGAPVLDASGRLIGLLRGDAAHLQEIQREGYKAGSFAVPATDLRRLVGLSEAPTAPGQPLSRDEIFGRTQAAVVLVVASRAATP